MRVGLALGVVIRDNMLLVEGAIRSEFGYPLRRGEWGMYIVGECGRFSCKYVEQVLTDIVGMGY